MISFSWLPTKAGSPDMAPPPDPAMTQANSTSWWSGLAPRVRARLLRRADSVVPGVLVVDRALGGGSSALSGGVVYAGGGAPSERTRRLPRHARETVADYRFARK